MFSEIWELWLLSWLILENSQLHYYPFKYFFSIISVVFYNFGISRSSWMLLFFFLMFYSLFLCGQFLLRCIFKVIISLALWNLLMSLLMWFFIFVSICFFLIIFVSFYHMFFIFLLELPTCSCILSIFQLDLLTY